MTAPKDPLSQVEDIFNSVTISVIADQARSDAEVILVASVLKQHEVRATFLAAAQNRGPDYLTTVAVAAVLAARSLARKIVMKPHLDFGEFMYDPDADAEVWDHMAHDLVKRLMSSDISVGRTIVAEVRKVCAGDDLSLTGHLISHMIDLAGELVLDVMDVQAQATREVMRNDPGE